MKKRSYQIYLILFFIFNSACAFLRKEGDFPLEKLSVPLIAQRVEINQRQITSLEGQGYLLYDSPDFSDRANASVALHVPDSLVLRLRGPVGVTYASLLVTGSQITYYNNKENTYYRGPLKEGTIRQLTGFDFMKQDIFEFFTGLLSFKIDSSGSARILRVQNEYRIAVRQMPFSVDYHLSLDARYLTACSWYDTEGHIFLEKSCEGFNKVRDAFLPKIIRYTEPQAKRDLTMFYTYRSVNKTIASETFRISIPSNAQPIKLSPKK